MYDQDLKRFNTHCSKCIFATYTDGTQTGCQHNRLDKFKKLGRAKLTDVSGVCTTAYTIDGICNTCRWRKWETANRGRDLVKAAKREAQIRMDVAIVASNQDTVNIEQICKAVNDCVKQAMKPLHIIVALQHPDINYRLLYQQLYEIVDQYDIQLRVVRVTDQDADISSCVNMALAKCKASYVAVFLPNATIPPDFIQLFDNVINQKLNRVLMVVPEQGYSGLIIQLQLFQQFGKNHNMPIFTKIHEAAELQNNTEAIITWNDLWNRK
jgi:hypothetical protein